MQRGYAICATPRSGSNYLSQALASTGVLGAPRGYFNTTGRRDERLDYPADPRAQIAWILREGATQNGVYAFKTFPEDFAAVLQRADLFALMPNLSFVRLRRRDLLGQAISCARAVQTKQFKSNQARLAEETYSAALIERMMVTVACAELSWDVYFARTALPVLTLHYEDVDADPNGAAAQIATLMQVPPPKVDASKVTLAKQRDGVNEAWRARYLQDMGGRHFLQVMGLPS